MYSTPKNYASLSLISIPAFRTNTREKLKYFEVIRLFIEFQKIIAIKLSSALLLKLVTILDSYFHKI